MSFLIKQIKTWLVILGICIPILVLGNLLADRNGLLIGLAASFILLFFSLYHHPKNPLVEFKAERHQGRDPWHLIENTLAYCDVIKLTPPDIYIIPSKQPFVLVISPTLFQPAIAFSQGLLDKLNPAELETILILSITTLKKKTEWLSSIFERCGLTLLSLLEFLDKIKIFNSILKPSFQPIICLFFKLSHPPSHQLSADQNAKNFIEEPQLLAQALWKTYGALAINELKFNPCSECYFLVLPHAASRRLFQYQPSIEKRLKNLVGYFPI
jgi:Zn-dependent protease with chaperone function